MSTDKKAGLHSLVKHLRSKADSMREGKDSLAKGILAFVVETMHGYGQKTWACGKGLEAFGKSAIAAGNVSITLGQQLAINKRLQTQAITFASNLVDNGAARLHELANIVESVANQPEVQDAAEQAAAASTSFGEVVTEVMKVMSKVRTGKPKLRVVKMHSGKKTAASKPKKDK